MINKKIIFFILFFTVFNISILAGDITVTGTPQTAYLLDSKISGVDYKCDNGNLKKTGSDGSFTYDNTCTNITFSLNNKVALGSISVSKIPNDYKVYLTNLAGKERADTNNTYVKNLATLLQSLDIDENPYNGIDINSSSIVSTVSSIANANQTDLLTILTQQYPTRTLVSENCALVHLEQVLRDDGTKVDTVPPCKPKLVYPNEIFATSNDNTYIDLIGERNSKIFLNGVDTNQTLDNYGKNYEFLLNPIKAVVPKPAIRRNTFNDYNITFVDDTNKTSEPLNIRIFNDTDQPIITNFPVDKNITVTTGATYVIDLNTTDDSITNGLTVSYEVSGTNASEFEIKDKGVSTSTNGIKYQIWTLTLKPNATSTRPLNIQIKVKDKANHYDIKSLRIN